MRELYGVLQKLGELVNVDKETGIRYGVIHQNEVLQAWADSSEPEYCPCCPYCGELIAETYGEMIEEIEKVEDYHCPKCKQPLASKDFDNNEPALFIYEEEGYRCQQYADDPDIFICKSPYFTYCALCSLCAPGAGYIMQAKSLDRGGVKAYCFSHDWFDEGTAPYPVFSVETGEIVNP